MSYYDEDPYEDEIRSRTDKRVEAALRVKPAKAFFVFAHSNDKGDVLFIGEGTGSAWFSRRSKSYAHDEAVVSGEISEMKIVSRHASKAAAHTAKLKLIRELKPRLNEKPKYRPTHRSDEGGYYAAGDDLKLEINATTVDIKRPSGIYGELFDDLSEFFATQAGVIKKDKKSFSLKKGTKWGDMLSEKRGKKLQRLKTRAWFLNLLFLHGYKVVSVEGSNGGTTLVYK